jgi:hypothetical protein
LLEATEKQKREVMELASRNSPRKLGLLESDFPTLVEKERLHKTLFVNPTDDMRKTESKPSDCQKNNIIVEASPTKSISCPPLKRPRITIPGGSHD